MPARRAFCRKVASLLGVPFLSSAALAVEVYPAKTITMMVPYPAGGASDAIARLVSEPLGKQLGQRVLVENLGGVGGALGALKVLSAPADGYHVLQGSPNELILSPLVNATVKIRSEDFRLVQMIGAAPLAILARKNLRANTADELAALALRVSKTRPLTYGSVGIGSFYHMVGEQMARVLGAVMVHVPYKGGAPLMQDLGAGQLDFAILPVSRQQLALAGQGRVKVLATTSAARPDLPGLRSIPTVNEGELLKGFNFSIWTGYFVRKDTPEAIVQKLNRALNAALQEPDVRGRLEEQNLKVAPPTTPAAANEAYEAETARYRAIAEAIGLRPQ